MGHYQKVIGELEFPDTLSKEARNKLKALLDPNTEYNIYNEDDDKTYSEYMDLFTYRNKIIWQSGDIFGKSVMSHNTINHLIKLMTKDFPEFTLTGSLRVYDMTEFEHYDIDMIDNVAVKVPIEIIRKGSVCNYCGKGN